ncbi:MAG: ADP-ribosylglycohydrolase family protein [Solirubrobacterales bacterium]|nr:ADP-ribosylglycohydrolase family protein [Solirubrobacterales bacterium]
MLGLAVGDALGTTVEFRQPGTFEPLTDMVGGGPFRLPVGAWTDDTSMALCLAESLIEKQGFDPQDQIERYVRWWKEGYLSSTGEFFDIGNATRNSLQTFLDTSDPYAGDQSPNAAGNGALMRLAPVPLAYARNSVDLDIAAARSSRTTHGALESVDACRYYAGLIGGALNGATKEELIGGEPFSLSGYFGVESEKVANVAAGSFREKQPPEINGGGYVIDTLEAALWALYNTDDFESGALKVVNLGDDADTTGAVYGQLAGAIYGVDDIPGGWLDKLVMRDEIEGYADRLLELSERLAH